VVRKKIKYSKTEIIILCVVRNGAAWIRSFIEHYTSLGAKCIVFLDNNSTDNTVYIAQNYKSITVLRTKLPFKNNEL